MSYPHLDRIVLHPHLRYHILKDPPPTHTSQEMQKDVNWWLEYIRTFNEVNFIINPATTGFTYKGDACLDGGGGFHGEEYWSRLLPHSMLGQGSPPIHLKEFWVLLVSIKLWGHLWSGSSVELYVTPHPGHLIICNQKLLFKVSLSHE